MCTFELHQDLPPCPSPLLPVGSDQEVSPDTIESSLVTVILREEFIDSGFDSLEDVPSLPIGASEVSFEPSSSIDLPDPSPYFTYVKLDPAPVLPMPERPHISPRKKRTHVKPSALIKKIVDLVS